MILRIGNKQRLAHSVQRIVKEKNLSARRCSLSTEKGLTLIEVLLAVSIMAIGVIGVLQAFASSLTTLQAGQYTIDATGLIKQKMADIGQMALEAEETVQESESGTFESPFEDFLWEWKIEPTEIEGLGRLTLKVAHLENSRAFMLNTYLIDKNALEEDGEEEE